MANWSSNHSHKKLICSNPFRLEEYLMTFLFGELDDFILDRWTIARANPFNLSRIHRRFVEVLTDDVRCLFRGESDVARQLTVNPVQNGTWGVFAV